MINKKEHFMEPQNQSSPLSSFEKVFVRLAPILIFVAAILLVITMSQLGKTKYAVKETAAYTRVSNCIVAKVANPPTTQVDVEQCYVQVEKDSDIPLERFDSQVHNESTKE